MGGGDRHQNGRSFTAQHLTGIGGLHDGHRVVVLVHALAGRRLVGVRQNGVRNVFQLQMRMNGL